jgi:hypothetical protein
MKTNIDLNIMKKTFYETPSAELLEMTFEGNFLTSFTQEKDIPKLEEEDGWGDSIWG